MTVQKILPIARKMGKENFLAYKNFHKNSKLTNGKEYTATLNLTGINLLDTIDITLKDKEKLPKGFLEIVKVIFSKYFPRSASKDAKKAVVFSSQKFNNETQKNSIITTTKDKEGVFAHSFLIFEKKKNKITTNIESSCENVLFKLATILNLPPKSINGRYNLNLNLGTTKDILIEQIDDKTRLSLSPKPTKDIPFLGIQIEATNKVFESIFGGELENELPDLIKNSGFMG